ncbi:uncharacterized protein LOC116417387 [Nasonia vitripennis]|uniref:Gag protein n=1 Tax=Nasonia vitripennis TaxID=7425 RepID=A0A7M7QI85_NASVI|nr:uncharacterized protein LOC116417387 [Nasonia vitripennis]
MVHDFPRISDATRLQYLKMFLTGSAADFVKEIPTTNANYASTWKALELRYHNPRLIITKYLTAFIALPHLKKESGDELCFLIDEATRIVRALENLKMPIDQWDVWFVLLLSERLDPESRSRWESLLSEKERKKIEPGAGVGQEVTESSYTPATFHEFIEFLETRAQTLGVLAPDRRGEKRSAAPLKSIHPRKVFHANSSQCPLCAGPHALMRCSQYKEKKFQDRQKEVKRLRLCFNCLGHHRANSCSSSGRCSECKQKHHSSLHDPSRSSQGSSSTAPKKDQGNSSSG